MYMTRVSLALAAVLCASAGAFQSPRVPIARPSRAGAPSRGGVRVAVAPNNDAVARRLVSEGAASPPRDDAAAALDVPSLGFLLGAAALWGTYPTCVKLLYRAGPPIDVRAAARSLN